MFCEELELLKSEPMKGNVGIDLIIVPRVKGVSTFWDAASGRVEVLTRV